ncbi:hypothetical protein T01_4402 [Trichinella spiralis]|uniref:Uncharacterized protein n=1 Tax=Trichinella spiralis TaxID=6334 RepID=A0A0V1B2L0_TRISP|nr:hypothetical protein T01_4402 [Trichinella spiralis]
MHGYLNLPSPTTECHFYVWKFSITRNRWHFEIFDKVAEGFRFSYLGKIFCRGLELHVKKDRSQPTGDANLIFFVEIRYVKGHR